MDSLDNFSNQGVQDFAANDIDAEVPVENEVIAAHEEGKQEEVREA
mgnify:CR=1 FL=1